MQIPERKIEEIRAAVDIVDVIGAYVQLKKRGRNYIGLCPFHQEKTGSFTVSSEKQIYKCFGCQAGGNVFKFVMDYENISFVEAVQQMAKRSGINLEFEEKQDTGKQSEQEVLYDISTHAARYFSNNLLNSPEGEAARQYFAKRNIKLQTQRTFGLGYAAPYWEGFYNYALQNKLDLEKSAQLGLIEKRDGSGYYDKFRDRVIFPIFSPNGRVIAFGGRIMGKSDMAAKYLNSPENPIYLKRKTLYGLFHSKDEIRRLDKAILVEGYIDLIALFQNGIKNVVASCGTALTEEQVQMLARYTKNIVVFYDSDAAGIKASIRSIEILVKQDFDVKIAELPEGEDPDSFINRAGRQEFEEVMKNSKNFLEYQTLQYEKQGRFNDPLLQTQALRDLVTSASYVNDELKRNLLLKSIARKFNLREKLLETELEKVLSAAGRSAERKERRTFPAQTPEIPQEAHPGYEEPGYEEPGYEESLSLIEKKEQEASPAEQDLIRLLFEGNKGVIRYIFTNITPEDFTNPDFQLLAELVYEAFTAEEDILPAALVDKIKREDLKQLVLKMSLGKYSISKTWEEINPGLPDAQNLIKYTKDSIRRHRLFRIDKELEIKHHLIENSRSDEEIIRLMTEKNHLLAERRVVEKGD